MALHPQAGKPAKQEQLVNVARLVGAYYTQKPDPENSAQAVAFGTSGHRGSSLAGTFNDVHIAAICQALAEYRAKQGTTGPMFIGMDTHALSESAFVTAVEVLTANGVQLLVQQGRGYTPTPVISHAILNYNKQNTGSKACFCRPSSSILQFRPSSASPIDGPKSDNARYFLWGVSFLGLGG